MFRTLTLCLAAACVTITPLVVGAQESPAAETKPAEVNQDAPTDHVEAGPSEAELTKMRDGARALLDSDAQKVFDEIGQEGRGKIIERLQADEELSPIEQQIVRAMGMAIFEVGLDYKTGDIEVGDGLAVFHLGDTLRYLGPEDAKRLLEEAWGNPPSPAPLGMLFPADTSPLDQSGWGVVITFADDGYVDDDDAEDIDYDDLLETMQQETRDANPNREAQGYEPIQLAGWAEAPHYDSNTHRLYWAKELVFGTGANHSLNYSIRILGRRGVLELNAVAGMNQLALIKPAMETIMPAIEFSQGHRYADFDPDVDKVAAYGIGGLIAGKVLLKAGFFGVILKFLIVAKKFLIIGAIGLFALIRRFVGRREEEVSYSLDADANEDETDA